MCLGIPAKIVEIEESSLMATVDIAGNRRKVSLMLLPDAKVGDWVLVHTGFAIQLVDEELAKEQIKLLEELGQKDV